MQSLAGNKYVPRLGQIGCESDGRSVIKFRNFRIDFLFRLSEALEGKNTQIGHTTQVSPYLLLAATQGANRSCTY